MPNVRAVATIISLSAALVLAGCTNPIEEAANGLVEEGVENAIENETGADVDVNVDGSGASLPDGWPAGLAVPAGEIVASIGQDGTFVVQMTVAGPEALDEMVANLEAAGYTKSETGDLGELKLATLESADMSASVGMIGTDEEHILQISLTPAVD